MDFSNKNEWVSILSIIPNIFSSLAVLTTMETNLIENTHEANSDITYNGISELLQDVTR